MEEGRGKTEVRMCRRGFRLPASRLLFLLVRLALGGRKEGSQKREAGGNQKRECRRRKVDGRGWGFGGQKAEGRLRARAAPGLTALQKLTPQFQAPLDCARAAPR